MLKTLALTLVVSTHLGCALPIIAVAAHNNSRNSERFELTADDYTAAAPAIRLGMHKDEVLEILQPSQGRLKSTEIKQPGMYEKDGVLIEILYFRSGWQKDGLITDDEFTPYLFNDGELVAVGWEALGSPR